MLCVVCQCLCVCLCLRVCEEDGEEEGTKHDVQRKNVSQTVWRRGLETACFIDDSETWCVVMLLGFPHLPRLHDDFTNTRHETQTHNNRVGALI